MYDFDFQAQMICFELNFRDSDVTEITRESLSPDRADFLMADERVQRSRFEDLNREARGT